MDPVPLSTSPVVEGQNENVGVTKLTVHIPEASGDVQIAVKLIPESNYYDPSPVDETKIFDWTLPEGEIDYDLRINNPKATQNDLFTADIQIPPNTAKAEIFIDGKFVSELPVDKIRFTTPLIDPSAYDNGSHIVTVKIEKDDGTAESVSQRFEYKKCESQLFFEHSLQSYEGSSVTMKNSWQMKRSGQGTVDTSVADRFRQYSDAAENMWLDIRCSESSDAISGTTVVFEFDVEFSDLGGALNVECKSAENAWFMSKVKIFDNGGMVHGPSYETNKPYHVKLIADTVQQECTVYVDDSVAYYNTEMPEVTSVGTFKIQYTSSAANQAYSLSNLKISEYYTQNLPVRLELDRLIPA